MGAPELSKEKRILRAMKLTRAGVIRDTTTPAGMQHPVSVSTARMKTTMAESGCSELEPYALRVLGNRMEPELPAGCVVIVDPGDVAKRGSFVIVEYPGDVFFRQLVVDGERRFLGPPNPKYGGFELIPPCTVRGGVVQRAGRRRAERSHYRSAAIRDRSIRDN